MPAAHDLPPVDRLKKAVPTSGLFAAGAVTLARAPGRLDVMGGIADYTGSLVCEMPLSVAAAVAGQLRADGQVVCRSTQVGRTVALPVAGVCVAGPHAVAKLLPEEDAWARYMVGCLWWLWLTHSVRCPGVTLLLDSDVPLGGGVSSSAAIEVATMTVLCRLLDVELSPLQLAVACQTVENRVVGAPCGVMDQVTSSLGEAGSMLKILCQPGKDKLPAQLQGNLDVPAGFAFAGINSGVRHEVKGDPYTDTRVAAFMGQKILSTLQQPDLTKGYLARVDAAHYRHRLRERLPETLTGSAFAAAHGSTNDTVTKVIPEKLYNVRAATDHHVYEMARVDDFVRLLSGELQPEASTLARVRRAGLLMYDSHRSYGQCAGLGHALTDRIVELVMALGSEHGFYGAKITGGGCGGTVAILLRDDEQAWEQVQNLIRTYEQECGRQTMLFRDTSPGAASYGTQTMNG